MWTLIMCGICGYVGLNDQEIIERMTLTLVSRGPDDGGTHIFPDAKVAFGHRRLSILDLTKAGHQPMFNHDKTICITYNGEIYNFINLRKELEKYGVRFKSRSDTEVIIACYERFGIQMVRRLDGIFAIAIYDTLNNTIYLVRDHVGVKPLYYAFVNGKLLFGSEIKAILASNIIVAEVNQQALWDYLTYNYVPCPLTMYKNIYQVPPAHILSISLATGQLSLESFWNPLEKVGEDIYDPEEINYLVRKTLSQTVKEQLISDVPVGAFLSGGIDSNIIVGLMAEHSSQRVRTFTAIFTDKHASSYNEEAGAERIACKFDTIHEKLEIPTPTLEDISTMLSWTDQPFGNPTLFLSYLISKEIKRFVTVALAGAGGDELFGGYVRYKHFALARSIIHKFPFNFSLLAKCSIKLWPSKFKPELRRRVYKFIHGLVPAISQHYIRWAYFLEENKKTEIVLDATDCLPSSRILEALFDESNMLNDLLNILEYVDLRSYLVDDILEYTDKSSMATSLEVRVPFLSPKMIELSLRIPGNRKIDGRKTKVPLREAFAGFFPMENLKSPKKGFSAPIRIWASELDSHFDSLESKIPHDFPLNMQAIKRLRNEERTGRFDYSQSLFSILMLETWLLDTIYK